MRSALITGVTGFAGNALARKMAASGWQVRGTIRSVKQAATLSDGIEVVQIKSIGAGIDWSDALAGVDTVVHLAARVHVMKDTATDPLTAFREVNVAGTERLARMAAKTGVKRFIFLSTVKVNGEITGDVPFSESDIPNPEGYYAISKWEAELILHRIAQKTRLQVVILRLPLVYGTGVKANFLRLLDMVNKNIPSPLSMVNNRRSFIYIGNLVDAIIRCIEHPNAANQTYLVSDGQDVSTPELIRMISCAMGKKARLFPCPLSLLKMIGKIIGKSAEIERLTGSLQIDSAKIRRELSWTPPFTMEQGLKMTADWFISNEKNI
ncbi:MAG: NAD-dependent dehydratase [Nitrospira bacterium HGW-Nitrospira-1]|nr:MAG: NAD-dependent dehydratase [Nitrospira bacterium HGW-Nitrospira-1]